MARSTPIPRDSGGVGIVQKLVNPQSKVSMVPSPGAQGPPIPPIPQGIGGQPSVPSVPSVPTAPKFQGETTPTPSTSATTTPGSNLLTGNVRAPGSPALPNLGQLGIPGGAAAAGSPTIRTSQRSMGQPSSADPASQIDPFLSQTLKQRAQGIGIGPSFEDITENVFNPMAAEIDRQFSQATDSAIEDLVSRGVLNSSTSVRRVADLAHQAAQQKSALLGQLGLDFERNRQERIGEALNSLGVLEGHKLQSRTAITTANISATAQIKSAAIQAGATVAAAQINAQATLQRAGLDWKRAIQLKEMEINQSWEQQGIDPERFQNDPLFRETTLKYFADQRAALDSLRRSAMEQGLIFE